MAAAVEGQQAFDAFRENPSKETLQSLIAAKLSTEDKIMETKRNCWRTKADDIQTSRDVYRLPRQLQGKSTPQATTVKDSSRSDKDLADCIVRTYMGKQE